MLLTTGELCNKRILYILVTEKQFRLTKIIENGECIAIATRQKRARKGLQGICVVLYLQYKMPFYRVIVRMKTEIPFHLIPDEFRFTSTTILKYSYFHEEIPLCSYRAIQNMAQLREISEVYKEQYL